MSAPYQPWTGLKHPAPRKNDWKPLLPYDARIQKATANFARRLKK